MLYNPLAAHLVIAVIAQRLRNFSTGDYLILGSHPDAEEIFSHLAAGRSVPLPDILPLHLPNPLKFQEEDLSAAKGDLLAASEQAIVAISIRCPQYPRLLRFISDPPLVLWAQGNIQQLGGCRYALSVVGSRRAQSAAVSCAKELAAEAARAQIPVVSGLATGIDFAAHSGALRHRNTLPTIAVLGGGLLQLYPAQHAPLAEQIVAQQGVILSEYAPQRECQPHQFIARNRIIAGLSQVTVVVQAAQRSGALATARFALENNRELFVAPGNARDPAYAGSHQLLKQGAGLVTSFADIAHLYPGSTQLGLSEKGSPTKTSPSSTASSNPVGDSAEECTSELLTDHILRIIARVPSTTLDTLHDALLEQHPTTDLSQITAALDALEIAGTITIDPAGELSLT